MKMLFLIAIICLCRSAAAADETASESQAGPAGPLGTIAALDVPRYMGTWFEIAKFPNGFQKKCVSNTTAEYSLKEDGTVQVVNRCRTDSGEMMEAVGAAWQTGAATSPKLKVRFAPAWLSFLPMVLGDYWVVDLDEQYQLVAVSEPKREYLWILARGPVVGPDAYKSLLERLSQKGFDLSKLQVSKQE